MKQVDIVLSGSGSRLIAFVGAYQALTERGLTIRRIAGTSGGAIIGALIAAGYTPDELYHIIKNTDFTRFKDRKKFSLFSLYQGNYAEQYLKTLLDQRHIRDFEKVPHLHVVVSDITHAQMRVFSHATTPDCPVYRAVRMSMSIPFVFADHTYQGAVMQDGGIHALYPIGIFDDDPTTPTIGLKIVDQSTDQPNTIYNGWDPLKRFVSRFKALGVTLWRLQELRHIDDTEWSTRTVKIFTTTGALNFDLTHEEVEALYLAGYNAAQTYLATNAWHGEPKLSLRPQTPDAVSPPSAPAAPGSV